MRCEHTLPAYRAALTVALGKQPMLSDPGGFGCQRLTAARKWTEHWSAERRKVCQPLAGSCRLDVGRPTNLELSQRREIDRLAVEAAAAAAGIDADFHERPTLLAA